MFPIMCVGSVFTLLWSLSSPVIYICHHNRGSRIFRSVGTLQQNTGSQISEERVLYRPLPWRLQISLYGVRDLYLGVSPFGSRSGYWISWIILFTSSVSPYNFRDNMITLAVNITYSSVIPNLGSSPLEFHSHFYSNFRQSFCIPSFITHQRVAVCLPHGTRCKHRNLYSKVK